MRILIVLLLAFCISCDSSIKEKSISTYYDIDSLLNKQLGLLINEDLSIEKQIFIDGEEELHTVSFDSVGWNNELAVFRIADINKPNLKGLYEATEEKSSEQTIWKYTTDKPTLGIEYLFIYFSKDNQVKKIEARYNENNALYTSERNLMLSFDPKTKLLTDYTVEGSQTMIMKDPVNFKITSHIL